MNNEIEQVEIRTELVELDKITFKEKGIIMWGLFWRGSTITGIAAVLAYILGLLIGGVLGIFMVILRMDPRENILFLKTVGVFVGLLVGFLSFYPMLLWFTKSKIGKYRFGIFTSDTNNQTLSNGHEYRDDPTSMPIK
jgi:ABC-type amino acid transport system permease subunit